MAKNLFVNTTGLPIEKEMPSLIGMDLSGVGKEPLKLNIGKTISEFANKAQALKEQANATKLYNQLIDEEQAWKIEYLSDPNAFANKERRTEISKSYNSLIERKKAIIMGAKDTINSKQYSALENQFKQQTYNSLFDLQTKMNSAFVQESVESLGIEKNALVIKCANTGNRDEIMQYQQMLSECFNAEASLGIDNREQAIKTLMTIEDNYLQRKVVDEIINNTTSKEYAKTENGVPMLDSNGNYIIDTNKVLTAVTNQRNYLLSKAGITDDAKKIAKMYNMSEDEAYNYIYNARDQFFKVRQSNIQANLVQKGELERLQLVELEEEMNEKREKVATGITKDLNNNEPMTKAAENFGSYLNENAYFNSMYFSKYTNGDFNDIIEMNAKGMYVPVTLNSTIDKVSNNISNAKDKTEILGAVQELQNIQTTKGTYNKFQLIQIQNRNGIPYGTTSALLGQTAGITSDEAMDIYVANQRNDLTVKNINRNYSSKYSFPFTMTDTDNLDKVLKNIDSYPTKFFTEKQTREYLNKKTASEKFNFIMEQYRNKDNTNTVNAIDSLAKNINKMNTVNKATLYQTDKTENSQFLRYGLDVTDNQLKKRNARKLYKAGEGNKLFDVDINGNIVSAYGYPRDAESLSTTDLDAYNSVLKELLYDKKINFSTINNFENGVIFNNQHNFNYFSNVILNMIKENKLNDIDMIISIPTIFSDNNPEIRKFIEDYEKTIE